MIFDEYVEIFNNRGNKYDQAMRKYPGTRDQEFLNLFKLTENKFNTILDLPAGGGYFKHLISGDITEVDPCEMFLSFNSEVSGQLEFEDNSFDCITCLAALHHVIDKSGFINECMRILKPGGSLLIGDVIYDSNEALFLDDVVDKYTLNGHNGVFFKNDTSWLKSLSNTYINHQIIPCNWTFDNNKCMLDFCKLLFGLENISDSELLSKLEPLHQDNVMQWDLLYVQYLKQ